ncbi:unnamed protein product [Rotaria magnacalcarata]|uniref:Uncharacterized protein n=1 Tax=Rotaria magnacalcarata TaxID=392030 RepID=A0A816XYV4_9BILA|nr:unnamed protein product [Rotaria magnacalcarata]
MIIFAMNIALSVAFLLGAVIVLVPCVIAISRKPKDYSSSPTQIQLPTWNASDYQSNNDYYDKLTGIYDFNRTHNLRLDRLSSPCFDPIDGSSSFVYEFDELFIRHWDEYMYGRYHHPFIVSLEKNSKGIYHFSSIPKDILFDIDSDSPKRFIGSSISKVALLNDWDRSIQAIIWSNDGQSLFLKLGEQAQYVIYKQSNVTSFHTS